MDGGCEKERKNKNEKHTYVLPKATIELRIGRGGHSRGRKTRRGHFRIRRREPRSKDDEHDRGMIEG